MNDLSNIDISTGSIDFKKTDFDIPVLIDLCADIQRDIPDITLQSETGTIDWLNELLRYSKLYEKIRKYRPYIEPSKEAKKLLELYLKSHEEQSKDTEIYLKKLNRKLLSELYPQITYTGESLPSTLEIVKKTIDEIYKIVRSFLDPETIDTKVKEKWKILLFKMIYAPILLLGIVIGAGEVIGMLYDKWEKNKTAERYANAAKEIYEKENNPTVALQLIAKAIELNDDNVEYRHLQAYIEGMAVVRKLLNLDRPMTKEELDEAHKAMAQAIILQSLDSNKPEPYVLKGQIYVALNEKQKAEEELQKATKISPNNAFVHVRLAVLLADEKKFENAMKEIDLALQLDANNKWAWLWKGIIISQYKEDWIESRKMYDKALSLDQKFDIALYNIGWSYMKQKQPDYSKAKEYFDKAVKINPDYKEAYYGLGMVYGYQSRYEMAKVYFDKAIKIDKSYLTAWKWKAIVQDEMGKYKEAIDDFSSAIELAPSNTELYIRRARVYEKTGDIDAAVKDLRYAIEIAPNEKRALYYLGNTYFRAKDFEKALFNYELALKADPKYSEAYASRSEVWMKLGKKDKALEDLNKAVEYADYRPERFLIKRASFYESIGKNEEALKDYDRACEENKTMAEIWMYKAKLLKRMNRKSDALVAINRYIELKPQAKDGQEFKRSLK